ncbi:hypothetical protein KL937_003493 [Ogataea polymorpha]|uniref:uncharacterized protein n=1 Tax=Ogataea polymorpha TaxID=460523 RepID=UPI0007F45736|nr:uncharacterized protein OGAPODRAFT_90962 [Ogataea polymorpha]KAG7879080.1 hypothetical protein KL937_003493 [Ogataea polymorpha]KAG7887945.1 hypothetical protein KL936_003963 [Ogataea polymorpha]KAG7934340.1 hypothetical protein KL904_003674 [Ogataea polymorpha]OBA13649.1 hypothetical protein OGAPODRAFT_90962 [Ogataea polymorpha]
MKLDTIHMRYLNADDWRVLQAVENGSRSHEVVPTKLIGQIANLKTGMGSANRAISDLAKLNLISKLRNAKYDGYRLTYNGFDYLALRTFLQRKTLVELGSTIGVGKESDIYAGKDGEGNERVLKIHRLGRVSFRTVKNKRDYLRNKEAQSWMHLSKLAAEKEYEFMTILYGNGFEIPRPLDYSRHCVVMELVEGFPMRQLREHFQYKRLYSQLMQFMVKLANHGLIHCDYNEYNIMIREDGSYDSATEPGFLVIDFPQCISINHVDAEFYFKRDVECIRRFFKRRFGYSPKDDSMMLDTDGFGDGFRYAYPVFSRDVQRMGDLDLQVKASGYRSEKKTELEDALGSMRRDYDDTEEDEEDEEEEYGSDLEFSESVSDTESVNEKIVQALVEGEELKTDKFGNYILEE